MANKARKRTAPKGAQALPMKKLPLCVKFIYNILYRSLAPAPTLRAHAPNLQAAMSCDIKYDEAVDGNKARKRTAPKGAQAHRQ